MSSQFGFTVTTAPGSGGTTGDLLLAAHGLDTGTNRALKISGYNDRTNQMLAASAPFPGDTPYNDFAVVLGSVERVHAIGCNINGNLDIISGDLIGGTNDLTTGDLLTSASLAGAGAQSCALDAYDDPQLSVSRSNASTSADRLHYSRDAPSSGTTTAETYSGMVTDYVDLIEGGSERALVFVKSDGSIQVTDDSGTQTVTGVSAGGPVRALVTGDTAGTGAPDYILTGVEPGGTAWFAIGNNTDGYTPYELVTGDSDSALQAVAWLDDSGRLHTFVETADGLRYGTALY
jgi:hypothetical protein